MDYRYKPDDYEIKLIILYSLQKLRQSPSYYVLSQVIGSSADINYFEIQKYIDELLELGTVEENSIDGETTYSLTESGDEMCNFFGVRIPASVRAKIDDKTYEINNDKSNENKVYADYTPINELEYTVKCGILENNVKLLDFEMYAGSKDRAKKICKYFKENTSGFYTELIDIIEKNLK